MDSIRRESEFQRAISAESHFEGEEYLKIVLRYSKRAEGLSGEKNRVEQDKVATVEETGFQTCVARGGRSLPLPFSHLSGERSRRDFFLWTVETRIEERTSPTRHYVRTSAPRTTFKFPAKFPDLKETET